MAQRRAPLSADDRGALLGEAQLAAAAAAALSVPARADLQAAGPNLSAIAGACRYRHHPWGLLPFMLSVAVYKQL